MWTSFAWQFISGQDLHTPDSLISFIMAHKSWNILNWNIRGINDRSKWLALRNKIEEFACDILCLQETKREDFDSLYTKNFCPKRLNKFEFLPYVGAPGGLFVGWNGNLLVGTPLFHNDFSISIQFTCSLSGATWILTNIYAPCQGDARTDFIQWFKDIDMPDNTNWLILRDFNFIRYPDNRNRARGDIQDMLTFNDAISSLALVEIPLKGRKFTWSNMQHAPLLEKLDWFFTSESWTLNYPNTFALPLAKPISDHTPCVIKVGTKIPKSHIFRFENFWLKHHDFKDTVKQIWDQNIPEVDSAKRLSTKFKRLRKGLKIWSKKIPQLATTIQDTNSVISFFDTLEEFRDLADHERAARILLKEHLMQLLDSQQVYWKQRATIRWIARGDTNAKFLKAKASIKFRNNHIAVLQDEQGQEQYDHDSKAAILWRAFKQRLGTSVPTHNLLNLDNL